MKAVKAAPQETVQNENAKIDNVKQPAVQRGSNPYGECSVGGKFKLVKRLGAGAFGEVYLGNNAETGEELAIKMELAKTKPPQLEHESKVYKILAGGVGVPRMHWYGVEGGNNVMVMDLMGPSLDDLAVSCKGKLTLKTVLMIADQLVNLLEYVHSKNIVHRDIKPENFLTGAGKNTHRVYIIDFGLAKKYMDPKTKQHLPYKEGKPLLGTARYASVNTHLGIEQSRRDDLEAVGHILVYLIRGSLPWQGIKASTPKEKFEKIGQCKASTPLNSLCQDMPNEFATFLNYCRNLHFESGPDYPHLRKVFKDLFKKEGYQYDFMYDWCRKRSSGS
jgi:casein kinase 1